MNSFGLQNGNEKRQREAAKRSRERGAKSGKSDPQVLILMGKRRL